MRPAPGRKPPLTEDIEKCSDTIYLIENVWFAPIPTLNARTAVDREGVRFVFGYDARANVIGAADALPSRAWTRLVRRSPHEVQTEPRERPANVKEAIIVEREFKNFRLEAEAVAEFPYQPGACAQPYRMVVVRKNISVEQGDQRLFDHIRYFFYLTNDHATPAAELVFLANERCNQENLIDQLKHGVGATRMPVDTLLSNWAYMVMAALAWTLKAWFALRLPTTGRWAARDVAEKAAVLRMEFKAFLHAFMLIPVQVVRTSRRLVFAYSRGTPGRRYSCAGSTNCASRCKVERPFDTGIERPGCPEPSAARLEDQPTNDNQASRQPDIEPRGEVRPAIFASACRRLSRQIRLFWD
jgi:hypothetical protein